MAGDGLSQCSERGPAEERAVGADDEQSCAGYTKQILISGQSIQSRMEMHYTIEFKAKATIAQYSMEECKSQARLCLPAHRGK